MSEKNESRTQAIRGYVDGKIQWLWGLPENQRRAELAKLRRGIGHAPGELPDLWGGLLQGMPASFYGTNGPSHEEWAVYLALTLYALHQQSNDTVCMSQLGCTLGRAVRRLAEQTVASGQSGPVPDRTGPRPVCSGGSTRWPPQKKLPRSAIICGG